MTRLFVWGAAALLALTTWAPSAQAGTRVFVGIGGGGYYGGPGCGPYGRPYYGGGYYRPYYGGYGCYPRPYYAPVYYAPPPVYYAPPPPVYVEQPVYVQQVATYSPTTWQVTQVQTQLGRLRYYQGSADGVPGRMTRNAVANFQQDRGLVVTGNINPQVLNALDISM